MFNSDVGKFDALKHHYRFYGINLNQNVVLQQIGFDGHTGSTAWEKLYRLAVGNIIITALGFVPGYYATILTVEWLGRKKIQLMGFLMEAFSFSVDMVARICGLRSNDGGITLDGLTRRPSLRPRATVDRTCKEED